MRNGDKRNPDVARSTRLPVTTRNHGNPTSPWRLCFRSRRPGNRCQKPSGHASHRDHSGYSGFAEHVSCKKAGVVRPASQKKRFGPLAGRTAGFMAGPVQASQAAQNMRARDPVAQIRLMLVCATPDPHNETAPGLVQQEQPHEQVCRTPAGKGSDAWLPNKID